MVSTNNKIKANSNTHIHERYKIELMSVDNVVRTLGVPSDRPRVKVMEITRRELRALSTATHAIVRALDGSEVTVYAADSWWTCQMKAFKL